jgi:putative sterol carrier protein
VIAGRGAAPLEFLSQAWFDAFVEGINASAEYLEAAADWEGDIAFHVEAEPDKGVPADVWALLDLWHGTCRGGGPIDEARGRAARYVIAAPYSRWRDVVLGDLDPVRGMMQGKLRVRGDLATIVRHVRAANELVRLTGTVPTRFAGEG